jgi:hypothetical protein
LALAELLEKASNMEHVLADVDANRGNNRIYPVGLGGAPRFDRPIQAPFSRRAGGRPHHSIN